tara:strand:- start:73 stop:489 length:417 start_codon:yes stop_codon:yes gene_type:complete
MRMGQVEDVLKNQPLDCGACNKCCRKKPGILLFPEIGDDPAVYGDNVEIVDDRPILKTKPNGDCVYLDLETGCTNYENRPRVCRTYDCRSDYIQWIEKPRAERRAMMKKGLLNQSVQKEGRTRLKAILQSKRPLIVAD